MVPMTTPPDQPHLHQPHGFKLVTFGRGGLLPGSGRSLHELILDDYAEREARVLGAPLTPSSPSSPPPRCGG
jgi:hypothetical protein